MSTERELTATVAALKGTMFFDENPEFLETSVTAASRNRLNLRHLGIIKENEDVLRGSTVVDVASHDGRWSYAALDAGADRVIGIEGRQRLVDNANRTFAAKGVRGSAYVMIQGDVHEELLRPKVKGNVVLCLGFLYHTARYVELMAGIRSTQAKYVIVDTRVIPSVGDRPLVEMRTEGTKAESVAIKDRFARRNRVISAVPSEAAVVLMLEAIGYEVDHRTDWPALLASHDTEVVNRSVPQYANGTRVTFRARRTRRAGPWPGVTGI